VRLTGVTKLHQIRIMGNKKCNSVLYEANCFSCMQH